VLPARNLTFTSFRRSSILSRYRANHITVGSFNPRFQYFPGIRQTIFFLRHYSPYLGFVSVPRFLNHTQRSWVSSGSIVSTGWTAGVRSPAGAKGFSSSLCVQTGSEAHPASCTMGTGGPFPGVKRGQGVTLTTHPNLVPRSGMSRSYTSSPPPRASVACSGTAFFNHTQTHSWTRLGE
jgi:hypothetical protein